MKPEKTIYKNQKEIHDSIINKLKPYLEYAKEAYLIGSLLEGKFGIYAEEHEGYYGSDIDVVIIPIEIQKDGNMKGNFIIGIKSIWLEQLLLKKQNTLSIL